MTNVLNTKPQWEEVISNTNRYLYEHSYEYAKRLYVRVFDNDLKDSYLYDLGTHSYQPEIFVRCTEKTEFKSFDRKYYLKQYPFNSIDDMKKEVQYNKRDNVVYYGNTSRIQKVIRDHWSDSLKANHKFKTMWLDIETLSGDIYANETITIKDNVIQCKDLVKMARKKQSTLTKGQKLILEEEVFDPEENKKVKLKNSCFYRKPGFPNSDTANYQITMLQMYDTHTKEFTIYGLKEWNGTYKSKFGKVNYFKFSKEKDMLKAFINHFRFTNPTAVNSYNGYAFDYPYIVNRMERIGVDALALSPVRSIKKTENISTNGMTYKGVDIKGVFLLDSMEFVMKYSFLKIPSFSLNGVAAAFRLNPKKDTSTYLSFQGFQDGHGYVFPKEAPSEPEALRVYKTQCDYRDGKISKEEFNLVIYDNFMQYSIRDVELMLEIEEKAKVQGTAQLIGYICGVNMTDVQGTLKQWLSYMYNDCIKDNVVLPIKQQDAKDVVYKAGWTTYFTGKIHKDVVSFDYAALYPSCIISWNIGADTLVPFEKLPEELQLKCKDNFYTEENFGEQGQYTLKYKNATNDIPEELAFFYRLYNDTELHDMLKKYNLSMTPNYQFYRRDIESFSAKAMSENLALRNKAKYSAQDLNAKLEDMKANNLKEKEPQKYDEIFEEAQYQEGLSNAVKTFNNSYYGSTALSSNPFSNGKLTAASITTAGRLADMIVAYEVQSYLHDITATATVRFDGYSYRCNASTIFTCEDGDKSILTLNNNDTIKCITKYIKKDKNAG